MAKRKGKSQQRQKDWQREVRPGQDSGDDAETRRRISHRKVRLPGQGQDAPIYSKPQGQDEGPNVSALVVQLYPGGAIVRTRDYGDLLCGLAGTFRPAPSSSALAVGDTVIISLSVRARELAESGKHHLDLARVDGHILHRAPRETALSRPQPLSNKRRDAYDSEVFEKVIAANMNQLVVVVSVIQPAMRRRLLDRYLIVAERGELPLILAVNKIDLGEPDEGLLADYAVLGVRAVRCSAATGAGLDELREVLKDRKSILAGQSGVGKSSLLNAIMPTLNLTTREVRIRDARGRHTTSAATLYELPFGGIVVDTPGVRELGLDIAPAVLPWYFPEIAQLAPDCKFRNCTHTHEPHCAVQAAAEAGQVPAHRYDSYLRMLEEKDE